VRKGHYFACDLDWAQPDPASDYGQIFAADQDWCATAVDIIWASGPDASAIESEFDFFNLMSIGTSSLPLPPPQQFSNNQSKLTLATI